MEPRRVGMARGFIPHLIMTNKIFENAGGEVKM
jgi:hypothetical protein